MKIILPFIYLFTLIAGLLFLSCNDEKIKKAGKIILIIFIGVPLVLGVIGLITGAIIFILLFMTCFTGTGR